MREACNADRTAEKLQVVKNCPKGLLAQFGPYCNEGKLAFEKVGDPNASSKMGHCFLLGGAVLDSARSTIEAARFSRWQECRSTC